MAQFIAQIQGSRGAVTRLGSKASGMSVQVNGWESGVSIEARYDDATGEDVFYVYATGGSNGRGRKATRVAVIREGKGTES